MSNNKQKKNAAASSSGFPGAKDISEGVSKVKLNKKQEESEEEESEEEEEEEEEEDEDPLANLPGEVVKRVRAVTYMQREYNAIEDEYKKERIALEMKYNAKKNELYTRRTQIVTGEVEAPEVPLEEGQEAPAIPPESEGEKVKGIPQYWVTALSSHPHIGEYITDEDILALQSLTDISVSYDEEYKSFTLTFHFADNDFFTNKVLTKKYEVFPDLLDDKSPGLKDIEGCEIDWKAGKCLTVKETTKKQKAKSGRNKGQTRTIVIKKQNPSFFHFFAEPKSQEEEEEEEEEKNDEDNCQFDSEEDFEIGHAIRTSIIPESILWFTGVAAAMYDGYYGDEDDEEDEDEDDEDEEEEDEDEEDEKPKPKGKKQSKPATFQAAPTGANGEKPAECKQN